MISADHLGAVGAGAPHFNHRLCRPKPGFARGHADAFGDAVIVNMRGCPAIIADQKNAIMLTIGVGIGNIGIGAFHAGRDIGGDEQIQDPINAIGRHSPPLRPRHSLCNVIGRGGLFKPNQRIKDAGPHRRPLLAGPRHRIAGGIGERVSGRQGVSVGMTSHGDETRRIGWPLQAGRRIRRRRVD